MSGFEAFVTAQGGRAQRRAADVQAASMEQQGQVQAELQRQNAAEQRQAGNNEIFAAEAETARVQDQGRRQRATARNALAGMGIDANAGSAVDVLDDLAFGSALDASIARWRGTQAAAARNREARTTDYSATLSEWDATSRAAVTRWTGKQAAQAANLRATSTLLTNGARAISQMPTQ